VSARHQVKRLDRLFEYSLLEIGPAEENRFSSFGADLEIRNFTGALCQVESGPDVFADALVKEPAQLAPGALDVPNPLRNHRPESFAKRELGCLHPKCRDNRNIPSRRLLIPAYARMMRLRRIHRDP